MAEYCKHGIEMLQTCRRCGRVKQMEVPNFKTLQEGFSSSIARLEETVRRMKAELENPARYQPGPTPAPDPDADADPDADPGPEPPETIYPWQRR